jgi:ectoine hydroxylase-related dioxygenase (phytanoyl-CoA dioxygenase family)
MREDLKKRFNDEGFIVVRDVFETSEIEFYREVVKEAIKERKQFDERALEDKSEYEKSFTQCQNLWEDHIDIRKLTFDQRICKIASELLDVDAIRLWHDQALVKESGGRETDPHHDQPYWPIKEAKTITAWIPLCDVDDTNGQLGFYPGSHKLSDKKFIDIFSGKVNEKEFLETSNLKSDEISYQELKAGDVSFHHGLTFHRAKPNLSSKDRIVHTAIFFADGSTRGDDKFHFSVDRPEIKVGQKIESDVTPLAYPIRDLPSRPEKGISDDFIGYKMLGLLPKE